jgi:hypothetical protein
MGPIIDIIAPLTNPVIISDSVVPKPFNAPTILISSPDRLNKREHKNVLNDYQCRTYFPIPDKKEMMEMARVLFPELDSSGIAERIEKWGCIPRHVFVRINSIDQSVLEKSVEGLSLGELKDAIRNARNIRASDPIHTVLGEYPLGQISPHSGLTPADSE